MYKFCVTIPLPACSYSNVSTTCFVVVVSVDTGVLISFEGERERKRGKLH